MEIVSKRKLGSNMIVAFTYGYVYSILFILCLGIFAAITGNITMIVIDIVRLDTQNYKIDMFRIFSILCGFVGVVVSQTLIIQTQRQSKNIHLFLRRLNLLQAVFSLALVIVYFFVHRFINALLAIILINGVLSLLMGIQVNNTETKICSKTYNNISFASNLLRISESMAEIIFQKIYRKSSSTVIEESFAHIVVIIFILCSMSIGIFMGSLMCNHEGVKAIYGIPVFFFLAYGITLLKDKKK
ncbi:MAG: hypothetical protein NTX05_03500 [Fusobacteria bacterium]|nr:hypothetical protein [Fusobacteriota bacterium]